MKRTRLQSIALLLAAGMISSVPAMAQHRRPAGQTTTTAQAEKPQSFSGKPSQSAVVERREQQRNYNQGNSSSGRATTGYGRRPNTESSHSTSPQVTVRNNDQRSTNQSGHREQLNRHTNGRGGYTYSGNHANPNSGRATTGYGRRPGTYNNDNLSGNRGNHGNNYGSYWSDQARKQAHNNWVYTDRRGRNYKQYAYNRRHEYNRYGDRFWDHYRYNRWNWNRPVYPEYRMYRPERVWYYRPAIPRGFVIYSSAPVIGGIFGLQFGTRFDQSLNYLYYNGYSIDGYYDNVVYVRDVDIFDYFWPDMMLVYDRRSRLNYAQFVYSSDYYDTQRYDDLYDTLCYYYGDPVSIANGTASWYGGDRRGYVTIHFAFQNGRYFTTLSFGN